jgi:4-hydroxybenzoyl-CoA thioesterase/acyl-CoA thioester hydrolase
MKSDFEVKERVRRSDVDGSGTINFAAYARLVEAAEHETLRSLGFDDAAFRRLGIQLRHVHLDFDFYKPVAVDDILTLHTRIAGVGAHSVRFKVDVWRASDRAQTASLTVVGACVDGSNRSVSMPAELADALRGRLSPD